MKKFKRWLALMLAVVLVGSNAIYSMSSALKANEIDAAQEASAQADSEPEPQVPESNNEGVDVSVVNDGKSGQTQEPQQSEPQQQTGQGTEQGASVTEPQTGEPQQPQDTEPEETKYDVVIHKPAADGGVVKVWTAGDKRTVTYDGNNVFKEEVAEGTTYNIEITANDGYEVEKVADKNGNAIAPVNTGGKVYTYSLSNIAANEEVSILYKEVKESEIKDNDGAGSTDESPKAEETAARPAKTLSETVDGTVITVEAPEGVLEEGWTLSVKSVSRKSVESAIEKALEEEKEISGIKAFDITILDKDGRELQPDGSVNVTFSNVGVKGEVLEVYHVNDSKKKAELVGQAVGSYAVGCEAEHFSIYTIVGTNWIYANDPSQAYEMYVNDEITLKSTRGGEWHNEAKGHEWEISDTDADKIKITDKKDYSADVKALKASDSIIKITHRYEYNYDSSQSLSEREEHFYIKIKDRQQVSSVKVTGESQTMTKADEPLQLTAVTDPAGYEVTWASSNPEVAKVSKDGKVTALKAGATKITASAGTVSSEPYVVNVADAYKLTFNVNGGKGEAAPEEVNTTAGSQIILPNYKGSVDGRLFVGWSTDKNAVAAGNDHYTVPVYPAGSSYLMPGKNVTLYAIWAAQNLNADFYIRKDGIIPTEPQGHAAAEYTSAIFMSSAIKVGAFYANTTPPGVADMLSKTPTDAQIKSVYNKYDPSTQFVLWYVIKHQDNWHVDGVLLEKSKVSLSYNANAPAGWSNMPDGKQYIKDSSATVSTKIPVREGYNFDSWNTKADGSGTTYAGGETFIISEDTTLYAQWLPKGDTKYVIEYYLQNDDGTYPDSASRTDIREGTTGAIVNSGEIGIDGYTYDEEHKLNVSTGEVKADGSLVLKRYYKKQFTVTYDPGTHGAFEAQVYDKQYYGEATPKFDGEAAAEDGYTFKGWNPEVKEKVSGNITYTAEWTANKATVSVWFYKAEQNSAAYVITSDGKLSTDGSLNKYSKEIDSDNKEGYSAEQIKAYADEAYGITEETDRYDSYEIQVLHSKTKEWETIDDLDAYAIQDGDDIRYHVTAEAAHKLTYVAGDHSSGDAYFDAYYFKGDSAAVKSFNDTGLAADTGYKFDHWENAAGETVSGSYTMGDKDTELKAVCVKDDLSVHELKYTVEYYKDGVIVTGDTKEIKRNVWINDDEIPVLPNDIDTSDGKYPGYHFTGTDPKEIGETVKNGATVKVYYAANTDTAYTVQRFYETDGSYKAEPDEILPGEGTTGQLADTIEYRSTDRPGYVYDKDAPGTIESGVIQGDGSLVLKVYFKQQFSVTYKPGTHGTFDDKTFSGLGYNADTPAFTAEGEAGYEFAGWAPDFSDKVTSSVEYVAQWKAADNTKYTVEYYYQNEGTYPETTENRRDAYGTTGDTAKLAADDTQTARAGYVYDSEYEGNVTEGTINGDGSLVLKVYFKQQFSVVYKPGTQGTFPELVYDDLDYGVKTPAFGAQPTGNPGYTFAGWGEVAENVTDNAQYTAQWTANTNTAYTVEHYQEQLNGSYTEAETENLTGTTGATAAATRKTYTGFTFNPEVAGTIESGTITGDGKLVLKLFYSRDEHTVTYMVDGQQYGEIDTYKYGQNTAPLREKPVKEGYTFNGWNGELPEVMGTEDVEISGSFTINSYDVTYVLDGEPYGAAERYEYGSDVVVRPAPEVPAGYHFGGWSQKEDFKMPAEDVKIEGSIIANENTKYRVEHYKENLDGTYTLAEERDEIGTTGTPVTEEPKKYEGYTYDAEAGENPLASGTIAGDGSLTLKLYYTRNSYKVTYKVDEAVYAGPQSYKYGEQVSIEPDAVKEGYSFSGWSRKEAFEMPASDVEITGTFTANGDTKYTVKHYLEGLDGKYVEEESEEWTGETDTIATANEKFFTGFTYDKNSEKNVTEGTITGDGKLVLKLYYTRDEHTVTYMVDGQQYGETDTYKYGQNTAPLREEPVKEGYTFSGWNGELPEVMGTEDVVISGSFTINSYNVAYELDGQPYGETERYEYGSDVSVRPAPEVPAGYHFSGWSQKEDFKMPAEDVKIEGTIIANDDTKYRVEHYKENLNGTFTLAEERDEAGTTGTPVTEEPKKYEGYTYDAEAGEDPLASGTIAGDGSLTLKLYYTRNSYDVTYKVDGAAYGETQSYKYGAQVSIEPDAVKEGYTFSGWSQKEAFEMPANDVEITGTFTANGDTKYTVIHYLEGLDGKYEEGLTEPLNGKTDTIATANPKTFTGFTYDETSEKNVTEGTITGDGKLVLKLYYTRDEHTVTYMVDSRQYGEIDTYKYGADIAELRKEPTKEGYTFSGWDRTLPDKMGTEDIVVSGSFKVNNYNVTYELDGQPYGASELYEYGSDVTVRPAPEVPAGYHFSGWSQKEDFKMPAKDVKIEGSIIANDDTKYRVEHYKENLNGTFTLAEGRDETGTTGTPVTEEPKKYEGYTYDAEAGEDPLASGTIAGDGSLTLKLYYTRNSYNVTYKVDGAAYAGPQSYKYGEQVSIEPDAVKEGYTFSGWSQKEAFEMPANDVEITGTFTANGDTKYTVIHYLEGLDGKYTEGKSEDKTGETDTVATANPTTFTGFTYDKNSEKNVTTGTITGDGKLVLKLYYTRDEHTVTYMVDGQQYGEIDTYKYDESVKDLRKEPTKEGHTFSGWDRTLPDKMGTEDIVVSGSFKVNSYNVTYELDGQPYGASELYEYGSDVTVRPAPEVPAGYHFSGWSQKEDFKMPAKDVKIEGSIIANDDTKYRVEHYKENLNGTFTLAEGRDETGTTGTPVTEEPKKYEGYTYDAEAGEDPLASGTIAGDGSLTLKLYYTRNSYNVTYKVDGAAYAGPQSYKYGEQVSIEPDAVKEGYSFSGWSQKDAFEMPANDVEITGTFTANGDTKFIVKHYLEGLDGKYTEGKSEDKAGETDTVATANPTTFTGFTYDKNSEKNVTTGTITGDGKLVLKLYYTRDEHTVTYKVDGQQYGKTDTYKYGADIAGLRKEPTKEGYTFSGWDRTLPDKMGTEDIVVNGSFTINTYKVTYLVDDVQYGAVDSYVYNSDVTLRNAPDKEGYTFSGWQHPDNFKMPAKDVVIKGTFSVNNYKYTVNYYYDNNLADDETVSENAPFSSTVSAKTPGTKERDGQNYMLDDIGLPYETTISTNEDANVINVYYVLDNNGPEGKPDGIPDSEEYAVTYNANAQNATGETVDNSIYPVDYQVVLKANGFVNEGYVFDGWSSGTDDQNLYQPNGWIKMAKGGLVMNAQWSAAPVTPAGTNPGGTTPGGNDTAAPANAGTITPAAVIQTITEPVAAFVQNVGNAVGANVQQLVQSDDEGVPLANRASKDHKCCILHFLLLLLALLVEIGYTRSMKKRQERIFELREEIAMADKEIEKDEAA